MKRKQIIWIIIIAFFVGTLGSVLFTQFIFPTLATIKGFSWVNRLVSNAPIIVTRTQEVQFTEGVDLINLVKQSGNITVSIFAGLTPANMKFVGNGIILSSDGLIFTSKTVVVNPNAKLMAVLNDGTSYPATARAADPRSDLLVLTIPAQNLPMAQLDDARTLQTSQRLIGLGESNRAQNHKFLTGFVTQAMSNTASLTQVDSTNVFAETISIGSAVTSEFAGGPVINLNGKIVGMMTQAGPASPDASRGGSILPAEDLQTALSSYLASGKIIRPFVGIKYLSLSDSLAQLRQMPQGGALVMGFEANSAAQKAIVLLNDLITSVDGQPIDGNNSFEYLVNRHAISDMKFGIIRNGQKLELIVKPDANN